LLTWAAVAAACHLPFAEPLAHGLHAGGQAPGSPGEWLDALQRTVAQINPFLLLLMILGLIAVLRSGERGPALLPGLIFLTVGGAYALAMHEAYGMSKYQAQMLPAGALLAAQYLLALSWRRWAAGLGASAAVGAMYLIRGVGDPLAKLGEKVSWLPHWWPLQTTSAIGGTFVVCAVVVLAVRAAGKDADRKGLLRAALLATALGYAATVYFAQARADYSTRYNYGERGMGTAVTALKLGVSPGAPIICPEDVAWYVGDTNFWSPVDYNRAADFRHAPALADFIKRQGIVAVAGGRGAEGSSEGKAAAGLGWPETKGGDYRVWLRPGN
jgi:hypothetical protein